MAGSYSLEAEGLYTRVAEDGILHLVVMQKWPRWEPVTYSMRVMLPYWTNSGNRSWTVTVDSKTFICNVSITTLAIIFRHNERMAWVRLYIPVTLNTAEHGVLLSIYSLWKLEREIEWMMRFFWKIRQRTHDSKRYSRAQTNVRGLSAPPRARPHVHVKWGGGAKVKFIS